MINSIISIIISPDPIIHKEILSLLLFNTDIYDTVLDGDAILLITEWKEFRLPSWKVIHKLMSHPVVFDGRNIYDSAELTEHGFDYYGIGK